MATDSLTAARCTSRMATSDQGESQTQIGIGVSLAAPPLPHHRTYGPVYGGSADYATGAAATEGRPSDLRTALERAMFSAGLWLSRQGPCGAPAVCAAKSWPTPRRRSSAKRVRPHLHCFQAIARKRRRTHSSRLRNTDGVSQRGLAEAEVAPPPNQVARQLLNALREAFAARPA